MFDDKGLEKADSQYAGIKPINP